MVFFLFMADSNRLYGLDLLRGVAMILGIFLHGAIAYKAGFPYGELIHDPDAEYYFFDWFHLWINSFRMQLFFVLAGFFACLLSAKIGLRTFAINRFRRIVVPLVLAYFTILPATLAPVVYYQNMLGPDPWSYVRQFLIDFYTLRKFSGLIQLWFLYDLLLFYAVALGFVVVATRLSLSFEKADAYLSKARLRYFIPGCMLLCGVLSQLYQTPVLSIWTGLITPVAQLAYYGFFFFVGWRLERSRSLLARFGNHYKTLLALGLGLSLINAYILNVYFVGGIVPVYDVLFRLSVAFQSVALVFGAIGLFQTKFSAPSALSRYLATSAYWVYLVHNPMVLTLQLLLLQSAVPGLLRFPLVIIIASAASYISYHYLVRNTAIGVLLNGKKADSSSVKVPVAG